jgi:formylmethanofuran dehydrogenase subunit C
MKGGTIVLRSGAELRTGAWMQRGTIISLKAIPLLPSFLYSSSYAPTFMGVLARQLASLGVNLPFDPQAGTYQRFLGDTSVVGKGEILVWNAHVAASV